MPPGRGGPERAEAAFAGGPAGTESRRTVELLDLGFFELDVLAHDRIIFVKLKLGGLRTRVLLGHVEVTRVRGGNQLDLNDVRFCHVKTLQKRAVWRISGRLVK